MQKDGTEIDAEWEDGMRVSGTMKFNPDTLPQTYEGQFNASGLRHGYGEYTYVDGSRYLGDWVTGRRHGNGVFFDGHGKRQYEGQRHALIGRYGRHRRLVARSN